MTRGGLTTGEQVDLQALERVVSDGLRAFVEVGKALSAIRDRKLFRETHKTFAAYCEDRWELSRSYAYRQIDAAEVDRDLSPIGDIRPATENVARELRRVDRGDRARVWKATVDRHGDRPTAAQTREVVREHRPSPEGFCRRKPRDGEACGKPVIDGRDICKGHALHDELCKDKERCGRFVEGRRGTLQALIDLGWSRQYALEKMRENYADARDGNGAA